MKSIDLNAIKSLSEKMHRIGETKEETIRIGEVTLHPHVLTAEDGAHAGEMMVVYHDRDTVVTRYRRAILTLDLSESEQERFFAFDQLDTFRTALEKRVEKTKLWKYAPDHRDAVKEARHFLETFLQAKIPYGQRVFVPVNEREAFLADEVRRLGVAEYYYCVEESMLDLHQLHDRVSELGHKIEEQIETLVTEPVHRVQQLGERLIEKIPTSAIPAIHLRSA